MLAEHRIARMRETSEGVAVTLRGIEGELWYPHGMPIDGLHQVIAEQGYRWAWHRYEAAGTEVAPSDVVFDCGAAEGLFSFLVSRRAARVMCFEPLPEFRATLERTFVDMEHVEVVPSALSDSTGTAYLRRDGLMSTLTDETTPDQVAVETIDGFCARTGIVPTYLKADVEGHELAVLRGGSATIRTHRPKIAITTYHREGDYAALTGFLRSVHPGYRFTATGIDARTAEPVLLHAY
jgi:FkbM family methyltransferase